MEKTPLSVSKFRLIFFIVWAVWTAFQAIVLNWLGFSLQTALLDSFVSNPLLAASCFLVSNNLKYYLPQQQKHWYILVLSFVMSALWLAVSRWVLFRIIKQEPGYYLFLDKSLPIRFGIGFLLLACMAMISVAWYTVEDQKASEKRKQETEKITKEAELYKLRQQLQPHFLFNSLNSISALIMIDPEQARTMIQQLSDFLRNTLRKEEQQWISLTEELQYLELYLAIEKVRFGHRLSTVIESDENSRNMKIPNMLLQPIVENAIKFGLYDTTGEIIIRLTTTAMDQQLSVTVQNPFDTETFHNTQGTGFGLNSVQRRLQLLFGRNDLLATRTELDLFITTVKIPQQL